MTIGLRSVSALILETLSRSLRYSWCYNIVEFIDVPQSPGKDHDDEQREGYSHEPERYENALLPEPWWLYRGHDAVGMFWLLRRVLCLREDCCEQPLNRCGAIDIPVKGRLRRDQALKAQNLSR